MGKTKASSSSMLSNIRQTKRSLLFFSVSATERMVCPGNRVNLTMILTFVIRFSLLLTSFLALSPSILGQSEIRSTTTGRIQFESDAPMELIQAASNAARGFLDPANLTFAFIVQVNSFQGFNNALQQDHFNENYLESETFKEATYSGRIIETVDLTIPGTYDIRAKGDLVIHGISRERIIRCQLKVKPQEILVTSEFSIRLIDHQIQVPRIVHQKIAEEIKVDLQFKLKPR